MTYKKPLMIGSRALSVSGYAIQQKIAFCSVSSVINVIKSWLDLVKEIVSKYCGLKSSNGFKSRTRTS